MYERTYRFQFLKSPFRKRDEFRLCRIRKLAEGKIYPKKRNGEMDPLKKGPKKYAKPVEFEKQNCAGEKSIISQFYLLKICRSQH